MTTQIIQIQNGTVTLPKKIQELWQGAEVIIVPSKESILIKRISQPSLSELAPKLRKLGKLITRKDVDDAVKWTRKKIYKSRS